MVEVVGGVAVTTPILSKTNLVRSPSLILNSLDWLSITTRFCICCCHPCPTIPTGASVREDDTNDTIIYPWRATQMLFPRIPELSHIPPSQIFCGEAAMQVRNASASFIWSAFRDILRGT